MWNANLNLTVGSVITRLMRRDQAGLPGGDQSTETPGWEMEDRVDALARRFGLSELLLAVA